MRSICRRLYRDSPTREGCRGAPDAPASQQIEFFAPALKRIHQIERNTTRLRDDERAGMARTGIVELKNRACSALSSLIPYMETSWLVRHFRTQSDSRRAWLRQPSQQQPARRSIELTDVISKA